MPSFDRYIAIDYSGANRPVTRLPGIKVSQAYSNQPPLALGPQAGRNWSRRSLAEALAILLAEPVPTLVGIDHGFSFPLAYIQSPTWDQFLDSFCQTWPTDEITVRQALTVNPAPAERILRTTETWVPSAKSVFAFGFNGEVGTSTFAGIPWLRYLRHTSEQLHFWPFDGFEPIKGRSVVVEIYPALFKRRRWLYEGLEQHTDDPSPHETDAFVTCRWLQAMDRAEHLHRYFHPPLTADEQTAAHLEGWILGVA